MMHEMQVETLKRNGEQECRALRLQVTQLEKKLEQVMQNLASTQAALSAKEMELSALQNNLMELEELREMKEVILFYYFHNIFRNVLSLLLLCTFGNFAF